MVFKIPASQFITPQQQPVKRTGSTDKPKSAPILFGATSDFDTFESSASVAASPGQHSLAEKFLGTLLG